MFPNFGFLNGGTLFMLGVALIAIYEHFHGKPYHECPRCCLKLFPDQADNSAMCASCKTIYDIGDDNSLTSR